MSEFVIMVDRRTYKDRDVDETNKSLCKWKRTKPNPFETVVLRNEQNVVWRQARFVGLTLLPRWFFGIRCFTIWNMCAALCALLLCSISAAIVDWNSDNTSCKDQEVEQSKNTYRSSNHWVNSILNMGTKIFWSLVAFFSNNLLLKIMNFC